jgi:hypothetical protein
MRMNPRIDGKTLYFISLHVIVIAFGFEIIVLTRQNEQLKESQDPYWAGRLKVGDMFSIDSLSVTSSKTNHPIEQRSRQLIFVFSTKCKFCKANINAWREIAIASKQKPVQVYAIAIDSAARTIAYLAENEIVDYDVYAPVDIARFAKKNRLGGVPLTILRSSLGNVEKYWDGTLDNKQVTEIIRLISE